MTTIFIILSWGLLFSFFIIGNEKNQKQLWKLLKFLGKWGQNLAIAFGVAIFLPIIAGTYLGEQIGWEKEKEQNKIVLLGLALYIPYGYIIISILIYFFAK